MVIAVDGHSPTLLNEDFLKKLGVVPEDWEPQNVLVTPPIAQVAFTNGFIFTVESNRFRVEVSNPELVEWNFAAVSAQEFVSALPHLRYRATGNNIHAIDAEGNPGELIKGKLLLRDSDETMNGFELTAMQWNGQVGNAELGLNFEIQHQEEDEQLIIKANYHRVSESLESVIDALGCFERDLEDFSNRTGRLLT